MKDCQKCIHINFTEEDYAIADSKGFVVERLAEKQYGTLDRVPVCIHYGKVCSNYKPCLACKEDKYINFKERFV